MYNLQHPRFSSQAPQKQREQENGSTDVKPHATPRECNGAPLLSECVLQGVRSDLQLHLSLSALFTVPLMLSAPSLLHWSRSLRYQLPPPTQLHTH